MQPIVPRALRSGDTLALVAPSGPLDRPRIERAIVSYEQQGFRIKTYRDIYTRHGYLAGNDKTRAAELMQAFADPEVAAVVPARGGTGITRLLDRLNFDVIRNHPKILTGFSDITALHLAVFRCAGLVSFHSPNPMDGPGHSQGFTELTERTYWCALLAESYAEAPDLSWEIPLTEAEREPIAIFSPGQARGRLIGGNLALICSLLGTPYEIETRGNILLLEDVGEQPYRIDRYLSQLKLCGKLDELAGIVLGQFADCEPNSDKPSLSLADIFQDYFAEKAIPILKDYPTGHTRDNATLPLGVQVELDADAKTLRVLENPVQL